MAEHSIYDRNTLELFKHANDCNWMIWIKAILNFEWRLMQPAFTHTRNRMILINVIVNLWRCRTVQKRVH